MRFFRPVVDGVLRLTLDFIDVGLGALRFYVFNVADVGLSVGAVLVAYAMWRADRGRSSRATRTAV
jgi:lipoprotein signal peptidase